MLWTCAPLFINYTANDNPIGTCANCGGPLATATPETRDLPADHNVLRLHAVMVRVGAEAATVI